MKKKAWIVALVFVVLGVVGYFLFGFVRGSCGENLRWTFNRLTGHLSIRGSGDMTADFEQAWCEIREDVRSVSLPDGLTSIGNGAFDFCRRLTSMTIPEGVRSIGDMAFKECYALADLTLPKSLTSIGFAAFRYCTALRCVKIPESVRSIEAEAFSDCEFLTDLTLPEGLRSIGEEAFQHCHDLTDVTIPNSVISLGANAFANTRFQNENLQEENGLRYLGNWLIGAEETIQTAELRAGTMHIADHAFSWCDSLRSVVIPDGVTSIGRLAFLGCAALTDVTIPDSVTEIGEDAFSCCELTVFGEAGSAAETYARENGIDFRAN